MAKSLLMAPSRRVLLIGLASLDIINICERYPKEDEDAKALSQYWQKGGNAANSAQVMSQLGSGMLQVSLLCSLSDAFEGNFVRDELIKANVDVSLSVVHKGKGFPTSCCFLSQETGTRTIVHCRNGTPELTLDDFQSRIILSNFCWVHFETRNYAGILDMLSLTADFRDQAKDFGFSLEIEKPKYLKLFTKAILNRINVIFISKDVAANLGCSNAKEAVLKFKRLNKLSGSVIVVCPWGEHGVDALDEQNVHYHCDAHQPAKIVDTLGAGDTFIAGFLHCFVNGCSLMKCLETGCFIAGEKCGKIGYEGLTVT